MSGMMQQGKDGRWMDYSSGMGQYAPNYKPPAAKTINPANDPLTDNNYLGQGQSIWNMKPAAPSPNSMQTHGLMQAPSGNTYTGNAAAQLQGMGMLDKAPAYMPARVDDAYRSNMLQEGNDYLRKLTTDRVNPFTQGGTAYTSNMNYAQSQPSGLLQQALKDTQRAGALSGFGANSGLMQQSQAANRLAAAKQRAQMGADVERDMSVRAAGWDDNDQQFKMQLGNALNSGNFSAFDRLRAQENDMYGRRLDSQLDPLKVQGLSLQNEGAMLGNANQRTANQYQAPMLGQQYQAGAQNLEAGQYRNDFTRATQPGAIGLMQAQQQYGMKDANYSGQYLDEAYKNWISPYEANTREAMRNPLYRGIKELGDGFTNLQLQAGGMVAGPLMRAATGGAFG